MNDLIDFITIALNFYITVIVDIYITDSIRGRIEKFYQQSNAFKSTEQVDLKSDPRDGLSYHLNLKSLKFKIKFKF